MTVDLAGRASTAAVEKQRVTFVPPNQAILLIIGQDVEAINGYMQATNQVPAGIMAYTSIQELQGLEQPVDYGGGIQHAQALIERYPQSVLQLGLWMVEALEDIAAGQYDPQIDRLGAWMAGLKRPVYLRIGYEFDFPENGYEPAAYVRAYRYLVDWLRGYGINNVASVWHSYAADNTVPLAAWYPGDDYVDWCAISYFDQNPSCFEPMAAFAREHQKPLMIAEATPRGIGTSDTQAWMRWFRDCAAFIDRAHVKALSYINVNWEMLRMFQGQGWGDTRIEANPAVQRAWLEATNTKPYLRASPTLYKTLHDRTPHD